MKVLMLAEELGIDYDISVVVTKDEWYHSVHPERYVPTIRDQDAETKQDLYVFESTACLQYLADTYDKEGLWHGKTQYEKGNILSWLAYQTAGLGCAYSPSLVHIVQLTGHIPERHQSTGCTSTPSTTRNCQRLSISMCLASPFPNLEPDFPDSNQTDSLGCTPMS